MPRRRRLTLVTCCGVHGLQDGLTDLVYVLLPILAQSFGLSYAQVGTVRAINQGAMTLFELPSGMLSERLGERVLLGFGLLCVSIGYLGLASVNTYAGLLVSLFVAGAGAAFQHSLSSAIITKTFQGAARRVALGTYNASGDIGKLTLAGLFTLMVGVGVAWQGLIAGFGALALLAAFTVFVVLRRLDAGSPPHATHTTSEPSVGPGWGLRHRTAFAALAAIVFFDIAVQTGFLTFLAFLMIEKQVPVSLGAFAVVLTLAGGALGKFACGFLAARLGVIHSLVLVECLTAIGILAILLLPTVAAYCLLPFVGAALQGSSSITYGSVGDFVDEPRQSRGFGMIYSTSSLAGMLAPLGFGVIGDQFGVTAAMLTMACVTLVPLPLCLVMRRGMGRSYA